MKNDMNLNSLPLVMAAYLLQAWPPLLLAMLGVCMHRMGPAFERSRFGPPIALLGLVAFILLPDEPTGPEKVMHDALISSLPWIAAATAGTLLVLRGAPTYWAAKPGLMILGWAAVSLSWVLIWPDLETSVANELLLDFSVIPGLMLGAIAFALGVGLAEQSSAMMEESSPLTDDEGRLVHAILTRRLGGDEGEH
jgi:hypothetical protein